MRFAANRAWQVRRSCYTPRPADQTDGRGTVAKTRLTPTYTTRLGKAYHGDALDVLRHLPADSVALAFTSPPFALRRQKAYGNVAADEYIAWFWPIAEQIHRVLRPDGSFVMDLG